MFQRRKLRRGFTLPEVLVTVAIVAVLAAVVVPAVTQQLSKGDAPSLQSSIGSLQTGITAFVTDVRKFPMRLSHLSTAITANDSTIDPAVKYGSGAANSWKGPYMSFTISAGDSIPLGMKLKALDSLVNESNMVRINLSGVTDTNDLHLIDSLIDNKTGRNGGNFRFTATTATATAIWYYLVGAR